MKRQDSKKSACQILKPTSFHGFPPSINAAKDRSLKYNLANMTKGQVLLKQQMILMSARKEDKENNEFLKFQQSIRASENSRLVRLPKLKTSQLSLQLKPNDQSKALRKNFDIMEVRKRTLVSGREPFSDQSSLFKNLESQQSEMRIDE